MVADFNVGDGEEGDEDVNTDDVDDDGIVIFFRFLFVFFLFVRFSLNFRFSSSTIEKYLSSSPVERRENMAVGAEGGSIGEESTNDEIDNGDETKMEAARGEIIRK